MSSITSLLLCTSCIKDEAPNAEADILSCILPAEMLKLKDFYIAKKITEEFLLSDDLLERTLAEFRRTQPFRCV